MEFVSSLLKQELCTYIFLHAKLVVHGVYNCPLCFVPDFANHKISIKVMKMCLQIGANM